MERLGHLIDEAVSNGRWKPLVLAKGVCIPVTVCGEIEKLTRNFVWGSSSDDRKSALLKWDDCCRPIESGGLGIRSLAIQNKLFLLKLGFLLLTKTDDLWVKVVRGNYKICGVISNSIATSNCSYIQMSLMRVWQDVVDNVYCTIGNGFLTNFWNDNWIPQVE
ncbi:hypothetical protein PVK06_036411 [Gossypium arboreum]|uniref:Uncharacterized protein n=1 Tax=Gossypium arboreum TaxID=29729 RepID=A0ABR0NMN3_GOSAR|nr:hypothetical protein PVK06_036411 [Gossypium arboreum]